MLPECKLLVLNITFHSGGFYSQGLDSHTHGAGSHYVPVLPSISIDSKIQEVLGRQSFTYRKRAHYLRSHSWSHCWRQFLRVYAQTLENSSCHFDWRGKGGSQARLVDKCHQSWWATNPDETSDKTLVWWQMRPRMAVNSVICNHYFWAIQ